MSHRKAPVTRASRSMNLDFSVGFFLVFLVLAFDSVSSDCTHFLKSENRQGMMVTPLSLSSWSASFGAPWSFMDFNFFGLGSAAAIKSTKDEDFNSVHFQFRKLTFFREIRRQIKDSLLHFSGGVLAGHNRSLENFAFSLGTSFKFDLCWGHRSSDVGGIWFCGGSRRMRGRRKQRRGWRGRRQY